jgi:glycosyl transferase family 25
MVVLISLETAEKRRRHMTAQLAAREIPFERVGIDLRACDHAEIERCARSVAPNILFDSERLSGPEIGCWLSHLTAWRRVFSVPGRATGVVIEDDVVLSEDFAEALVALEADDRFEVVLLGTSSRNLSRRNYTQVGRFRVQRPVGPVYNTWGYVIRRAYARRLLGPSTLAIAVPIDHVLGGRNRLHKPTLGVVQPAVVREHAELGAHSQIEPHTSRIDRWSVVEQTRRRILASRLSEVYYSIYRFL